MLFFRLLPKIVFFWKMLSIEEGIWGIVASVTKGCSPSLLLLKKSSAKASASSSMVSSICLVSEVLRKFSSYWFPKSLSNFLSEGGGTALFYFLLFLPPESSKSASSSNEADYCRAMCWGVSFSMICLKRGIFCAYMGCWLSYCSRVATRPLFVWVITEMPLKRSFGRSLFLVVSILSLLVLRLFVYLIESSLIALTFLPSGDAKCLIIEFSIVSFPLENAEFPGEFIIVQFLDRPSSCILDRLE